MLDTRSKFVAHSFEEFCFHALFMPGILFDVHSQSKSNRAEAMDENCEYHPKCVDGPKTQIITSCDHIGYGPKYGGIFDGNDDYGLNRRKCGKKVRKQSTLPCT